MQKQSVLQQNSADGMMAHLLWMKPFVLKRAAAAVKLLHDETDKESVAQLIIGQLKLAAESGHPSHCYDLVISLNLPELRDLCARIGHVPDNSKVMQRDDLRGVVLQHLAEV